MKNLQSILEQDYPKFEVIVVNHMSTDETKIILEAFQSEYENLRVITINKDSHLTYGKKFPLSVGIKGAKNDILVMTDADCKPNSVHWLEKIVLNYEDERKEMVLGYGPMNITKGFLNWFIRMETTYIAINYFSFALAKLTYMSVGRNLSYKKQLFEKNSGFKSHYSIISGDDDLFVQETATKKNVAIEIDEETWCYSDAKTTWKSWILQKRRHFTSSPNYKFIKKALLGSYSLSWLSAVVLFVILSFDIEYCQLASVVFGFIFLLRWIVFTINFYQLKSPKMAAWFPFWEVIYLIITPIVYFTDNKMNDQRWK